MPLDSYVTLGRSGLRVSPFTLGTMTFGEDWAGAPATASRSAILAAYLERGGNFIDTANVYTNGHSEKIIGDYFARQPARRDRVVHRHQVLRQPVRGRSRTAAAPGRKAIVQQLRAIAAAAADRLHRPLLAARLGPLTPDRGDAARRSTISSRAGKVRYIGFSDMPAWKTAAGADAGATSAAGRRSSRCSWSTRCCERTVGGRADPDGAGARAWASCRGARSRAACCRGKYSRANRGPVDTRAHGAGRRAVRDATTTSSTCSSGSPRDGRAARPRVALAWVQGRPGRRVHASSARARLDQLRANLAALDVTLTAEQRAAPRRGLRARAELPGRQQPGPGADAAVRRRDRRRRRRTACRRSWRPATPATERPRCTTSITFDVNGQVQRAGARRPGSTLLDALRDQLGLTGHEEGLRPGRVRRVHGAARRQARAVVPDARGAVRRPGGHHDRRAGRRRRRPASGAGGVHPP